MSDDIIIIENLHKYFGEVEAAKDINLRVKRGEVVVIVGPSGSGKSTVLRCVNHLEDTNKRNRDYRRRQPRRKRD